MPAQRREALVAVGEAALALGAAVLGYHSSGLPGPKGNRETFMWLRDPPARVRRATAEAILPPPGGRARRRARLDAGARGRAVREFTVLTHRRTR